MAKVLEASLRGGGKSAAAFRTISEVAAELDVPQHVLRFWETKFNQVRPLKRGGGRRYYRPEDIDLLRNIRRLLYDDGYTIKGVQKLLREGALKSGANIAAAPVPQVASESAGSATMQASRALSSTQRQELRLVLEELKRLKALLDRGAG